MNDLYARVLHQMVVDHGRLICDDSRRCRAMLRDYLGSHPGRHDAAVNVLINALEQGAARDLLAAPAGLPFEAQLHRLAGRLQEDLALTPGAARWAVATWGAALGLHPIEDAARLELTGTADPPAAAPIPPQRPAPGPPETPAPESGPLRAPAPESRPVVPAGSTPLAGGTPESGHRPHQQGLATAQSPHEGRPSAPAGSSHAAMKAHEARHDPRHADMVAFDRGRSTPGRSSGPRLGWIAPMAIALAAFGIAWHQSGKPLDEFVSQLRGRLIGATRSPYDQGVAALNKREYDRAIADLSEAIRLDPKNAKAFYARGLAWDAKKEYDKALADLGEAIRLFPPYAVAYHTRGSIWRAKKEYDKALADLGEAIRFDSKFSQHYYVRGLTWYETKEYDKALADLDEAIRLDKWWHDDSDLNRLDSVADWQVKADARDDVAIGARAKVYLARAHAWFEKSDFDRAIRDFDRVILSKTNTGKHWIGIDQILYNPRLLLAKEIPHDPEIAKVFRSRGLAWRAKKEYDVALTNFGEAIRLDPKYARAYYDRGVTRCDRRVYSKALADFDEAIRLDPKLTSAYKWREHAANALNPSP
jgi:tetratricopeptide (TPR) repeat protein